jgi:hypothetical protein
VIKVKRCKKGGKNISGLEQAILAVIIALVSFYGGIKANQVATQNNQATIEAQRVENLKQFRRDPAQYDRFAAVLKQATAMRNRVGFSPDASTDQSNPNYFNYAIHVRPGLGAGQSGPTTIENVHGKWQDAYIALDQAVSEAEIAASADAIKYARAVRDKVRKTYHEEILSQIIEVRAKLANNYDQTDEELAEALVGVPANSSPPSDQTELMQKSLDDLIKDYRDAVRKDLGIA